MTGQRPPDQFVQLAVAAAADRDSMVLALDNNGAVWRWSWDRHEWIFHSEHPRSGK